MGARKDVPLQNQTPVKKVSQQRFLVAYRNSANIRAACDVCGITRDTFYRWRDDDPEFRAQLGDAGEEATETLEAIAWQRARKISDTLLIFLLKARRPLVYRETRDVNLSGSVEVVKRVGNDLEEV